MGTHNMTLDMQFVEELVLAIRSHSPLPAFPQILDLEEAYNALDEIGNRVCSSGITGIKAGLTNPDIQALFGLNHALLGRLYDWGELRPGDVVKHRANAQIECEIAVQLNAEGKPVKIGAAIEFVYVNFSKPQDLTPGNLVATSLGADRYLLGKQFDWYEVDFNTLRSAHIALSLDEERILTTSPYDSLGGPEKATKWCVDEAIARGLEIRDEMILLCGTCGAGIPLQPGNYIADYGLLGKIEFTVGDA